MKFKSFTLSVLVSSLCVMGFSQCSTDDDYDNWVICPPIGVPNALVTVKHAADQTLFLQLDDNTTLLPSNLPADLYGGKQVRALTHVNEIKGDSKGYSKLVVVHWIDSIRTKDMVPSLGEGNDAAYGKDPMEIVKDWVTLVEDGYLTLRIRTRREYMDKPHYINLLTGVNPENPYELELRHNADGDTGGVFSDGLVAFDLSSLPDTDGDTVKLKLNWASYSGPKSVEFEYCTGKTSVATMSFDDLRLDGSLK